MVLMHITLSPQRRDDTLSAARQGDVLTINGEAFDFTSLSDGDLIPEVPCEWVVGPVERINGEIHLTLVLPHGPNPSQAVAFPDPSTVTQDGPTDLPLDPEPEEPANEEARPVA